MHQWLPDDDPVYFILDMVNQLDLKEIFAPYEENRGGYPAYHPRMMVTLLLYAYCIGLPSLRKIEQAYNCQAAVDGKSQVIVASAVTQAANDKEQVEPMLERIVANAAGKKPKRLSADAGEVLQ